MCRNIKTLFNFDPPATAEEIQAASLQYVRKVSGFHEPSKANQEAFDQAVEEVAAASQKLLDSLSTNAKLITAKKKLSKRTLARWSVSGSSSLSTRKLL